MEYTVDTENGYKRGILNYLLRVLCFSAVIFYDRRA